MPLLNDGLSVWDIGFRWAGRDPDRWWWRIPLPVRDNFRVLMDAILQAHLDCSTMSLEKSSDHFDIPPELFVGFHVKEIEACIEGRKFNRKLLRWAEIKRSAFKQWCERRAIPLPEFWFPPGWSEYRYPVDESEDAATVQGGSAVDQAVPAAEEKDWMGLRPVQRAKIASLQVADTLWHEDQTKNLTIKEMANRDEIQRLCGASDWEDVVVQRWLGKVDPRDQSKKRGPRRGK